MLIYFQYLSSIQSFFQLLHDYILSVHLEVLLLFYLSLLNTRKNLPKIFGRIVDLFLSFRQAHTFQIVRFFVSHTTLFQAKWIHLSVGAQGLQRFLWLATVKDFAIYNGFFYSFIHLYPLWDKVLERFPWFATDK